MANNKNPNQKQPGEKAPGKFHYNPGNMSGKTAKNKDESNRKAQLMRNKAERHHFASADRFFPQSPAATPSYDFMPKDPSSGVGKPPLQAARPAVERTRL